MNHESAHVPVPFSRSFALRRDGTTPSTVQRHARLSDLPGGCAKGGEPIFFAPAIGRREF
jgi:hypothetical protein